MITEGLRNDALTRHCTATRELEDIFSALKTFHAPLDPPSTLPLRPFILNHTQSSPSVSQQLLGY